MRLRKAGAAAFAAAALTATAVPAAIAQTTSDVSIQSFDYDPRIITVDEGDSVRFTNNDPFAHTASSVGPAFDTGTLGLGQSSTIVFPTAGSYEYFCRFHGDMRGKVNVRDVPDPAIPEVPYPALLTGASLVGLAAIALRTRRAARI